MKTFAEAIDDLLADLARGETMPIRKRVRRDMMWEYIGMGWEIEHKENAQTVMLIWRKPGAPT